MIEEDLSQGRNELEGFVRIGIPLQKVLVKGRFLESDSHDYEGCKNGNHMHWHYKILETYNPKTGKVLLSKKGSRRLIENLEIPDKKYSIEDLYDDNLIYLMVREKDHKLF